MARRKKGDKVDGWIVLDKPVGLGSTPAVSRVRRLFGAQKAGHGGTLDPLASGILPIALGEATKTVPFIMDARKEYRFTLRFGEARSTEDAEGEVTATSDVRPTDAAIDAARAALRRSSARLSGSKEHLERRGDPATGRTAAAAAAAASQLLLIGVKRPACDLMRPIGAET